MVKLLESLLNQFNRFLEFLLTPLWVRMCERILGIEHGSAS